LESFAVFLGEDGLVVLAAEVEAGVFFVLAADVEVVEGLVEAVVEEDLAEAVAVFDAEAAGLVCFPTVAVFAEEGFTPAGEALEAAVAAVGLVAVLAVVFVVVGLCVGEVGCLLTDSVDLAEEGFVDVFDAAVDFDLAASD
jgi:hypothetical protein